MTGDRRIGAVDAMWLNTEWLNTDRPNDLTVIERLSQTKRFLVEFFSAKAFGLTTDVALPLGTVA